MHSSVLVSGDQSMRCAPAGDAPSDAASNTLAIRNQPGVLPCDADSSMTAG